MKKPLIAALCVVASIPIAWVVLQPRGPVEAKLNGHRVSEVLRDVSGRDEAARQRAEADLRAAGTNAFAPLLEWISVKDPSDARQLVASDEPVGMFGSRSLAPAPVRRAQAVRGFATLGRAAASAATALGALLDGQESAAPSAMALAAIGPDGVSVLLRHLDTPDKRKASIIHTAIQSLGPADFDCVSLLLVPAKEANPDHRGAVLLALGRIGRDSERVIPVLVENLRVASPSAQSAAARALAMFGASAKSAAPGLLTLARNDDASLARLAAHALCKVAPEVAAREGIRDPLGALEAKQSEKAQ